MKQDIKIYIYSKINNRILLLFKIKKTNNQTPRETIVGPHEESLSFVPNNHDLRR